jgi:glutathione-regulated potassium-efflux system protein KefB
VLKTIRRVTRKRYAAEEKFRVGGWWQGRVLPRGACASRLLFFLAVGMSLDLAVVAVEWRLLLSMLAAFTVAKGAVVYAVARLFGGSRHQALHRTSMFLLGGEFAFVLYAAATSGGVIDVRENALFSTVVILSMALTPPLMVTSQSIHRSTEML